MADALVSIVLERLASVLEQQIRQQVTLVVGVEIEVDNLKSTLQSIRAVLGDAEKRQFTDELVKVWLERLKDISYQMDDVVDGWNTALLKLQIAAENPGIPKPKISSCLPSPCVCFKQVSLRHDIALQIKDIKKQLNAIANERNQFNFVSSSTIQQPHRRITSSVIDVSQFCGRDADINIIIGKLLGGSCQESSSLYIVSIVGMGGIGKTTLAQLAYNHERAILEALQKESFGFHDLEAVQQKICTLIAHEKFLLVLDDVWTENYELWEQVESSLKGGAPGSRILVTTRNENVSTMMGTTYKHPLGELSKEQCWSLFSNIAFYGRSREKVEELENIGRKIADKCRGLPLAAKVLGSLMRLKDNKEDWESILNNEIWQLDVIEKHLSTPLLLSYYDLSPAVKRCFSYCAVFPKDQIIRKDRLIKLWMANSYLNSRESIEMEKTGGDYFEDLVSRSLFQDFDRDDEGNIISCKMHDIVHDLAQYLTKNECFILEIDDEKEVRMASSFQKARHATLISTPGAGFPSTIHNLKYLHTLSATGMAHLNTAKLPPNLFKHLVCLRALDLSGHRLIMELPRNLGKLIHLRFLNLSNNLIRGELPGTICDLYNLQTLILSDLLITLPQGMRKLINLRHLEWEGSRVLMLPKGIGRLTSLRTLTGFPIIGDYFRRDVCKIGELKNLNSLRGGLVISGIAYVKDAEEAGEAELKNKKHLHHLELEGFGRLASAASKGVAEALQPHQNLKSLKISNYDAATEFPSWIAASSLAQLKKLEIVYCAQVTCLPPLGELPLLEILIIKNMKRVKYVGGEFLGSSSTTAFPKLKQLIFYGMKEWEKWEVKEEDEEEEWRSVMPCLDSLITCECPKLESLPERLLQITALQKLLIIDCPTVRGGIDLSKLSHISQVQFNRPL
ncbi:putative disease resistance protein RGA4 [Vitis vinifera]|uniref:Putative disease resistance protein RGA4 n=1 Tax=Vitis vinifera TaxID=29760 RepID=A0A438HFI2_VITVI|nr:putative disease resistance protein RGA4 [Vitis vinifera]